MIRRVNILLLSLLFLYYAAQAQSETGLEQYHTIGRYTQYAYMPVLHFQNSSQWYTEARYNYEDAETFSLYFGKAFVSDRKLSYSVKPLLGAALGKFDGISMALNTDLEYEKVFFSAQSQYSHPFNRNNESFLYSWSEIGCEVMKWVYAGFSFQQTYTRKSAELETGILIGFTFNRFTIPVYTFTPFTKERYFLAGLIVEWEHKRK